LTDTDICVYADMQAFASTLPDLQRAVLRMMFFEGYAVGEIADLLHRDQRTISDARAGVAKKLKEYRDGR
jgi:DNA-directed RNA polymerase specialized sigma24 family protein